MMLISNAKNPTWANPEQTAITLTIDLPGLGKIPFCASPADIEAHGRDLFERALAGEFGVISDAEPPSAEFLSRLAEKQAACDAKIEARSDNVMKYLTTHTPAEIKAWVQGKLPSLPVPEAAFIARLAVAIGALYREQ